MQNSELRIAGISTLPRVPSYKPELVIAGNRVAKALDHLQALRVIYAEMRAEQLAKIKQGVIVIKRLPYAGPRRNGRGSRTKFDALDD